jgi:hypothetical protein
MDTTGYGGTLVAAATKGSLLTDAQSEFFRNINLNIKGTV